jgi:hypothetical protein
MWYACLTLEVFCSMVLSFSDSSLKFISSTVSYGIIWVIRLCRGLKERMKWSRVYSPGSRQVCFTVCSTQFSRVSTYAPVAVFCSLFRSGRPRWSSDYLACRSSQSRGFKPGRGRWIFKGDEVCATTSFFFSPGGGGKAVAPWRKILQHVKESRGVRKTYFVGKIHCHFSPSFSLLRC